MITTTPIPEGLCEIRVHYRPVEAADAPWIYSSWLRTYERSVRARDAGAAYWDGHHAAVAAVLQNPDARGIVAVVPESPGTILGWIVYEPNVLHYLHVKDGFRRAGLGRALLQGAMPVGYYTHRTKSGEAFLTGVLSEAKYDPYQFRPAIGPKE